MRCRHAASSVLVACAAVCLSGESRAGEPTPAPEADNVVATVNAEPITRGELVDELLVRHGELVLEDMIRTRAVEQAMARAGVEVTEEEIDAEIERERERTAALERRRAALEPTPGGPMTLEEMVSAKRQMSMEGYRGIVRRWLLIRRMLLRRESPTDEQVMLWFYRNRERYDTPAEFKMRHIFIARVDPSTGRERPPPDFERRKGLVRAGLIRGEDFERLAKKHSDDRVTRDERGRRVRPRVRVDLGTVNERIARLHLEPALVEAMVRLKAGQSGGPLDTPRGCHFIEVTARKEGRKAEYEDFRSAARHDYLEERADMAKELFVRELMAKSEIVRDFTPPVRTQPEAEGGEESAR